MFSASAEMAAMPRRWIKITGYGRASEATRSKSTRSLRLTAGIKVGMSNLCGK